MRLRRYLWLASIFLLVPLTALIIVGILVLAFRRTTVDITFGVLILSFCAALLVASIVVVVMLKRAADLSQLQTDLLSKVSHEFKTPLTAIRMFAETLSEAPQLSDAQRRQCLQMLRRETDRLDGIIERWLDFGRMEAGKISYELRAESARNVIDSAMEAFAGFGLEEPAELSVEVPDDLPMIRVDRELMSQALLNLLHNAHKYGGRPPRIHLAAGERNRHVVLSVRDNGPGIPRRERHRIFQRFYRIDDRLSRQQEGTGLGLAIVRHVVHAHGGQVRVHNHPHGGAEFTIALPAA